MINESLYNKTVQILFDAYFNDTLEHQNCYACAVGNIIAANCGYSFLKRDMPSFDDKDYPLETQPSIYTGSGYYYWNMDNDINENAVYLLNKKNAFLSHKVEEQIASTGYSFSQLLVIEKAFESSVNRGNTNEEDMFNGLVAVLEVLKQIHQIEDDQPIRQKFTNHYQTLTLK